MRAVSFSCPHCAASLRIRDRALLGHALDCPDCGDSIRIEPDGRHGLRVAKAEPVPSERTAAKPAGTVASATASAPRSTGKGNARTTATSSPSKVRRGRLHGVAVLLAHGAARIPFPSAARRARWLELLLNPVGISWMAAAAAGFGLLLAISPWSSDPVAPPKTSQPANEADPETSVAEKPN